MDLFERHRTRKRHSNLVDSDDLSPSSKEKKRQCPLRFPFDGHENSTSTTSSAPSASSSTPPEVIFDHSYPAKSPIDSDVVGLGTAKLRIDGLDGQLSQISSADDFPHEPHLESYNEPLNNSLATEICFGMICDIGIRFFQEPALHLSELLTRTTAEGDSFVVMGLSFEQSRCELLSETGLAVATLNTKTFNSLTSLQSWESLTLEGLIPMQKVDAVTDASEYICPGKIAKISLNMYGQLDVADKVALELSMNGLFLQDPECMRDGTCYENPQYLRLPSDVISCNFGNADLTCPQAPQIESGSYQGKGVQHQDPTAQDFEVDQNLDLLLDAFSQQRNLVQAQVDPRVRAALLDHQKEGVDFVMKRESPTLDESRGLWELQEGEAVHRVYQHLITGAKREDPQDALGGILADDMGLGKSLVMIAAIVGSLRPAFNYALSLTSKPGESEKPIIAAKSTLIVVPSALLMDSWIDEINSHTDPLTISFYKYHGQNRNIVLDVLHKFLDHDVILTTYGTLAAEFKRKQSQIFQIQWYRIILDEAHMIRNAATNQFRAMSSLHGLIRWCLTGTPIQNTLDDLGSLIAFLKVPILCEVAQFRRHITRQTLSTKTNQQPNFDNLRLLLNSICLRRKKSVLPLHQSSECLHVVNLSPGEREAYQRLGHDWREAIELAVSGHRSKEAHQTVLEALLRMRIFCNNGEFFEDAQHAGRWIEPEEIGSLLQQRGDAVCYYCSCDVVSFGNLGNSNFGIVTACQHAICGECVQRYQEDHDKGACPICRTLHKLPSSSPTSGTNLNSLEHRNFPSKLQVLCDDIDLHKGESKCIVFSFWKKSLDIVETMLAAKGQAYIRVDGSVPHGQKKRLLKDFQAAEQGMVLLMTFGIGAVGLNNLSVANRIHILEPQWNPSVEHQAIGRVIRLGQTKPVCVVRYIVQDTVEKNVQNGQFRKLQLAKNGFGTGKSMDIKKRNQMLKDLIYASSASG